MSVGRYFCVALPFILTVASIVCILISGLTGVVNNQLYMFQVNLTDAEIDPTQLAALINGIGNLTDLDASDFANLTDINVDTSSIDETINNLENLTNGNSKRAHGTWHDSSLIQELGIPTGQGDANSDGVKNITAAQLGLANVYNINLWGFCAEWSDGTKNCTKAKFNWAEEALSTDIIDEFNGLAGINATVPDEFDGALNAFKSMAKWTQIVFIIAAVGLGIELVVGLFTACSRAVSCVTWLVSFIATAAVIAAASMMTVLAALVVASVEASGSAYDASASFNKTFLAILWLGVAFSLGASLFWLFSICCCKPEHRAKRSKGGKGHDSEKLLPTGAYQPLGEGHRASYNYGVPQTQAQRGGARSDLAYEPYSHSNV